MEENEQKKSPLHTIFGKKDQHRSDDKARSDAEKKGAELQKEIEELQEKNADLEAKLKRALADYQNFQTRVDRQQQDFVDYANKHLLLKILPVVDSLEMAANELKNEGLTLALKQFTTTLSDYGVEEVDAHGKQFDPKQHECIAVEEGPDNEVIEVLTKGYTLKGNVLRVARVKVGKKHDTKETDNIKEEIHKEPDAAVT